MYLKPTLQSHLRALLVFAEFYTKNNDGIQEIGNNSLIFFQVHFKEGIMLHIKGLKGVESVFAKKNLA